MTDRGGSRLLPEGAAVPLLVSLPILLASLSASWQVQWVCAVGLIVVLGVPHGALDVEIGRTLLRGRVGRWWFPLFAAPYLALVALVLVAWRLAPEATLAAFLAVSVWHFGTEETGGSGLPALVRGGLPIAVPVLVHPLGTADVLGAATGLPLVEPPPWLVWASVAWLLPAGLWVCQRLGRRDRGALALPLLLALGFALLPPLAAFTLYFVVVHAPTHTACLIRHPTRVPRVRNAAQAWTRALPTVALTVLIGAGLWLTETGDEATRLVGVTLQLLAALTLPHVLLDGWLSRRDRRGATAPPMPAAAMSANTMPATWRGAIGYRVGAALGRPPPGQATGMSSSR